jgi:hypothetical protein
MTLSDTDLEARLRRDLRARADDLPPAPNDLAELTRRRHRLLRRREYRFAGAALAAAVLLVGVPVVGSTLATDYERGQTAGPGGSEALLPRDSELYNAPTRGGLAGDEAWLAAVGRLPWWPDSPHRDPGMELTEPEVDSRHVAYADDVPSGRVALVVGSTGREVVRAWFVGPRGAQPSQMTVADFPGVYASDVVALVDGEPDADTLTLVVVARPDDVVERFLPPVVDAEGNAEEGLETLELDDGIAVVEVERRWAESDAGLFVQLDDGSGVGVAISATSRVELADLSSVEPADPRGLTRESELNPWIAVDTGQQLQSYGLDPDRARPTLLAWGTIAAYRSAVLVGVTFPSGATGMWLATYDPRNPGAGSVHILLPFGPAGTDLLDRVVAVGEGGGLVVSAPDGVRADVLDTSGSVLESLPMVDGAGTWPLRDPEAASSVRIVDEAGDTVAELPIEVYQ